MHIQKEDCEFYARTSQGFSFKVTIDTMGRFFNQHLFMKINKEGMFLSQGTGGIHNDNIKVEGYHEANIWNTYLCTQERSMELNLVELSGICKNIKKKYHLLIYILKSDPDNICFIPIPNTQSAADDCQVMRRIPITNKTLEFNQSYPYTEYKFHNSLTNMGFSSMCKNLTNTKCGVFMMLMYNSGRIMFKSEGTFSDCVFENGPGTTDEREHERRYIDSMSDANLSIDEQSQLQDFEFFTGTFNTRFLKDVSKINGYSTIVHIYADPIEHDNEETPIKPLCITCTAADSFKLVIYVKSKEQIEHEKENN